MGDRVVTPMGFPIPGYFYVTFVTGLYLIAPPALYSKRTLKWAVSATKKLRVLQMILQDKWKGTGSLSGVKLRGN